MTEEVIKAEGEGTYKAVLRKMEIPMVERPALGEQVLLVVLGVFTDFEGDKYLIAPTRAMFDYGDFDYTPEYEEEYEDES